MRTAIQNIQLTGKLTYVKIKEKETIGAKKKVVQKVNFGMQLNNRTSIFVESTLWNMDNPAPFTLQKLKEYMIIIEKFNAGQDVYISTTVKPNKDGSMFDKLSMYEKNDGTVGKSLQASVNYRKHTMDEDDNPIITFDTRTSSFEKPFSDCHPKFIFEMMVEEKHGQLLQLTDGRDYATRIIGRLPDNMDNKAKIGQGYMFEGELKKGERIQTVQSSHSWEDEAKPTSEFEPDYFILVPKGIIPDLKMEIEAPMERTPEPVRSGFEINAKPTKLGTDADLPF